MNPAIYFENLNDEKLLQICVYWGKQVLIARNKFAAFLGEVYRRELYLKKNCSSIFEFAAKFAGFSEDQVRRALSLEKRLENMPAMKEVFYKGQASISKIAALVPVLTPENDVELAHAVVNVSRKGLETYVKDIKSISNSVPGDNLQEPEVQLSVQTLQQLNELQKRGIDIDELIQGAIKKRAEEIVAEKEFIARKADETALQKRAEGTKVSRQHMPTATEKLLYKEYGTKCAIAHCPKSSEEIHHTDRYSISGAHNPLYLAPLCREHHEIAHSVDLQAGQMRMKIRSG